MATNTKNPIPILRDIITLCSFVHERRPLVGQTGRLSNRDTEAFIEVAKPGEMLFERQIPNEYWIQLLFDISLNAGIIAIRNNEYMIGSSCEFFLDLDSSSRIQMLTDAWRMSEEFSELSVIPRLELDMLKKATFKSAKEWRQRIVEYLVRHCEPGKWIATEQFLQDMQSDIPDFFRASMEKQEEAAQKRIPNKSYLPSWENNEARLVCFLLRFPLYWLGYITLNEERDMSLARFINPHSFIYLFQGYPTQFMLSDIGSYKTAEEQARITNATERKQIMLANDYSVTMVTDVKPELQLHMELMTEMDTDIRRCTPEAIWNALSLGFRVESIVKFFSEHVELPAGFLDKLQHEWLPRYGELRIFKLQALIVVRQEALEEIKTRLDESLISYIVLGDAAFSISDESVDLAKLVLDQYLNTHIERIGPAEVIKSQNEEIMDAFVQNPGWKSCIARRLGSHHALLKSRVWRRCQQEHMAKGFSIIVSESYSELVP